MKRKLLLLSGMLAAIVATGAIVFGCSGDYFYSESDLPPVSNIGQGTWQEQLQSIITNPHTILRESNISLLSYELIDEIDSNEEVNIYKSSLINDNEMIPYYTNSFRKIKAISKADALTRSSKDQTYTFSELKQYINSSVSKGMKILRLEWDNDGVVQNTLCLVSEDGGIVYDNFITNTVVIDCHEPTVTQISEPSLLEFGIPMIKTRSETPPAGANGIWRYSDGATAYWLFGSERGYANAYHDGAYLNGIFQYHDSSVDKHMSIGKCEARITEISDNKVHYVYALSTPYMKINISYSSAGFVLDFSGTIGSHTGAAGTHTWPKSI